MVQSDDEILARRAPIRIHGPARSGKGYQGVSCRKLTAVLHRKIQKRGVALSGHSTEVRISIVEKPAAWIEIPEQTSGCGGNVIQITILSTSYGGQLPQPFSRCAGWFRSIVSRQSEICLVGAASLCILPSVFFSPIPQSVPIHEFPHAVNVRD